MKLFRYGSPGSEKPGIVDARGRLRDLSSIMNDLTGSRLSPDRLAELASLHLEGLPLIQPDQPRFGCPVADVGKFIAIGLNYADHAAESNMAIPSEPVVFMKATTCIQGPNDPVMLPQDSKKTDWEVELGVVIGTRAKYVRKEDALNHVAGYCVVNDVSEREFQLERGSQWDKGKGCDTFGPIGPWLVTKDEIPDLRELDIWLDVNGQRMQTGSTRTMIFDVPTIVSYVSKFMTLMPGDVITTGTPPGVGFGQKPQRYLKAGDVMTLGIEGLGVQRQEVVPFTIG